MNFNHNKYRYKSQRNCMYAKNGMVATSSPLASNAGVSILKSGGNAIDAAIAAAAVLTVVEPTGNGIGGDLFAIFYKDGQIQGINSSGHAPKNMTIENLRTRNKNFINKFGLDPVTVPGIPAGWAKLIKDHGNLTLEEVLRPAVEIAENGFVMSGFLHFLYRRSYYLYKDNLKNNPVLHTWFDTYTDKGKLNKPGDILYFKNHARALREIGKTEGESFYRGKIAHAIDKFSKENNGFIRKEDLASFKPEYVSPSKVNYKGYDIWELPPNGIGIIALMALNILENAPVYPKESPESYHNRIEAVKLAFVDGQKYIGDLKSMNIDINSLLSKKYSKERYNLINHMASDPIPGKLDNSGTVYLASADNEGNMVSLIQSCFTGFGSGAVVPEWGISLHNRGSQFTLERGLPNTLEPGKKPYHTIIPGFITKGEKALGPFGIMGGGMQPQAHMQVISNLIDYNMNPQEALDAPRWQWVEGKKVYVEKEIPGYILEELSLRGHELNIHIENSTFGRGQIILKLDNNTYIGGTESRCDGYISIY